jgi:glycosyltransferase involved in cell wall biosynthesis
VADERLSIIVPIKDEAATLADLITAVEEAEVPGMEKEIVIVDDGSTDGTRALLDSYRSRRGFVVLHHDRNRGKGAAIRTALDHVTGSIVLIQDADREYDPNDHAALVEPIRQGKARVVYGSRFLGSIANMAWPNRLFNRSMSLVTSIVGGARITDEATCYKVFDTDLIRSLPLRCQRFEFCPEVTGLLLSMGEPIVEVPITYHGRDKGAGKKVRAKDGVIAFAWLMWSRFGRRSEKRAARLSR